MKTAYLFFVVFSFSVLNFAQVDTLKQIANFDFDSRNPAFLHYPDNAPWYMEEPEIFFEAVYSDSSRTICSLRYNVEADSFHEFKQISLPQGKDSTFICRNVDGKFIDYYNDPSYNFNKILVWETNINGNWDIAFSVDSSNGWTPQDLLISSSEDELNPSFITGELWSYPPPPLQMLYSCGNSVLIHYFDVTEEDEILFQGNDSTKYSEPTGAYWQDKFYIAAVQQVDSLEPHIVYRSKSIDDTSWSRIQPVFSRAATTSPKFTNPDFDLMLSFEVFFDRKKKILLMSPEDFGTTGSAIPLLEDPTIETSDFSAFTYLIVTRPQDNFYSPNPFTFRYKKNDSTFIRVGYMYYEDPYVDFYTKVSNSKSAVGPLGAAFLAAVSYTIWEDSSNGRINLFGLRRLDHFGDVSDKSGLSSAFTLSQNYPNPFNPTTNIGFRISEGGLITLKVYDVLGREVKTLVNEEKSSGNYEIEFDGTGLPSGVYFYQLKIGKYFETKKMILLK